MKNISMYPLMLVVVALLVPVMISFIQYYHYKRFPADSLGLVLPDSRYFMARPTKTKAAPFTTSTASTTTSTTTPGPPERTNAAINASALSYEAIINMEKSIPQTLKDFKNPCWYERFPKDFRYNDTFFYKHDCQGQKEVTRDFEWLDDERQRRCQDGGDCLRLRCFPYFFVVGAPKSGTTDLHHTLSKYHPHFVSGSRKESQFWVRRRHGVTSSQMCPENTGHVASFDDYITIYDKAAIDIASLSEGKNRFHPAITGDFTPDDMFYLWRWQSMPGNQDQPEPKVTLADHIHQVSPGSKIIFILRDPVERYRSHFYFIKKNVTSTDLHTHVERSIISLQKCLVENTPLFCVTESPFALAQGMYSVFVENWLRVFTKENMIVVRFEDYANDRLSVLRDIGAFLGLDPSLARNTESVLRRPAALTGQHKRTILAGTEAMLRQFYHAYNQRLATLLDDEKWTWGY